MSLLQQKIKVKIMKLTIIADDNSVFVDGDGLDGLDLSALDASIHAVQWYDTYGEVEYKTQFVDGSLIKPVNQVITSVDEFSWVLQVLSDKKAALAAEQSAIEAENAIPVVQP